MFRKIRIDRLCRVCLQQDKKMISVFEKPEEFDENLGEILECIENKFKQIEGIPQQICSDCLQAALRAFKFKRKCEAAYNQLIKILKVNTTLRRIQKNATTQTESTFQCLCEHCDEQFSPINDSLTHQIDVQKDIILKCHICLKSFNRAVNLRSHLSTFHPETDLQSTNQCSICNRQFINSEYMHRHLASVHKKIEAVDRNSCKQKFAEQLEELSNLPDIEEVDLKILAENSFIPDNTDDQQENDFLVYIKHFDNMTDEEDNEPLSMLQQVEKTNEVSDINQLQEHKPIEVDQSNEIVSFKLLETDVIEEKFKKEKNAAKPKSCRKKKSNSIYCDLCEKTFKHASQLQRHVKTKHQEKMYKCNICEKRFTTSTYLQRHVIMHAKKRYSCKECSENFLTKDELREHVKSEGHDKRLLCPECGLRCRTSNILMVHLRRHKGEKPFKCKFCSKGFPRSDDLRLHEKYHTGEKSHFCGTCGKGFQRKYNLKIHLRVHTGEKPYKCPHCPQAFAQANDLKAHIRRHTGERFRCELCDAAFLQGYQIRQHKLSEHGIRDEPPTQRVAKFTSIQAQKEQILQNMNKASIASTSHVNTGAENF